MNCLFSPGCSLCHQFAASPKQCQIKLMLSTTFIEANIFKKFFYSFLKIYAIFFILFFNMYFNGYAITVVQFFPSLYSLCLVPPLRLAFPPPYFRSMGRTYKFLGFSISYTILTLPLSILYLPFMLLIPCTFSHSLPPPPPH